MHASLVDITNKIEQLKDKLADLGSALLSLDKEGDRLKTFDVTLRITTDPYYWSDGAVECDKVRNLFEADLLAIAELLTLEDPGDSINVFNVTEIVEGGGES